MTTTRTKKAAQSHVHVPLAPKSEPEKDVEEPKVPVGETERTPEPPQPEPEHPLIAQARLNWARLDDRERAARAGNCLEHGHPLSEAVLTAQGSFCPHCCAYFGD